MDTVKRAVCIGLGLALALPGAAWAGGGWKGGKHGYYHKGGGSNYSFSFGFGPWWGWPGPWWYGPRYYYPYAYGYPVYPAPVYPAPVYAPYVEEPPVYIERDRAPAPSGWWYYCESAGAYYPDVPSCPEPWTKVPPRAE